MPAHIAWKCIEWCIVLGWSLTRLANSFKFYYKLWAFEFTKMYTKKALFCLEFSFPENRQIWLWYLKRRDKRNDLDRQSGENDRIQCNKQSCSACLHLQKMQPTQTSWLDPFSLGFTSRNCTVKNNQQLLNSREKSWNFNRLFHQVAAWWSG